MSSKCKRCGKTVYFAERTVEEGSDWHNMCLIAHQKEKGGIHNKGYYGTTAQDPEVVFKGKEPVNAQGAKPSGDLEFKVKSNVYTAGKFCHQCGSGLKDAAAKFCTSCGAKQ